MSATRSSLKGLSYNIFFSFTLLLSFVQEKINTYDRIIYSKILNLDMLSYNCWRNQALTFLTFISV